MTTRDPHADARARASRGRRGRFGDHDLTGQPETAPTTHETPAAEPHGAWRDQVIAAAVVSVIAGIWLIVSPWVIGYESGDATWNPIVFGALVIVFALGRIALPARTVALSVCNAVIGVWLFISGFWLADSVGASWNAWILGVLVFLLALAGVSGPRRNAVAR